VIVAYSDTRFSSGDTPTATSTPGTVDSSSSNSGSCQTSATDFTSSTSSSLSARADPVGSCVSVGIYFSKKHPLLFFCKNTYISYENDQAQTEILVEFRFFSYAENYPDSVGSWCVCLKLHRYGD